MSEAHNTVSLSIMGKLYKVKCPQDKIAELRESAQYLESKMRELSHNGKIQGIDRLIVITALNVVHELLGQKKQAGTYMDVMSQQIRALQGKIDNVLMSTQEDEIEV